MKRGHLGLGHVDGPLRANGRSDMQAPVALVKRHGAGFAIVAGLLLVAPRQLVDGLGPTGLGLVAGRILAQAYGRQDILDGLASLAGVGLLAGAL
ncbi:hypothetical protein [Oleomonas cavernae]|nr:hypothetical protein [Oleomonas cavernae]